MIFFELFFLKFLEGSAACQVLFCQVFLGSLKGFFEGLGWEFNGFSTWGVVVEASSLNTYTIKRST